MENMVRPSTVVLVVLFLVLSFRHFGVGGILVLDQGLNRALSSESAKS